MEEREKLGRKIREFEMVDGSKKINTRLLLSAASLQDIGNHDPPKLSSTPCGL